MTDTLTKSGALYALVAAQEALERELIENGGEITSEIEARLEASQAALVAKADSVALYTRSLEARIVAAKELAKEVTARARALENAKERFLGYVARTLGDGGRLQGDTFKVSVQPGKGSVVVDSPRLLWNCSSDYVRLEALPRDEYIVPSVTPEPTAFKIVPDKQAIREALMAGKEVLGAKLVATDPSVQIR